MRRLVQRISARLRTYNPSPATSRAFGHRYTDLADYISSKWGINRQDVGFILSDIFRFIEIEVLRGSGSFSVKSFGRFDRREMQGGSGPDDRVTVMRFTRSSVHRGGSYIDWEDEEWDDDDE